MYFQDLVLKLQDYWGTHDCSLISPYDMEKGAATFNPSTFLRALGPEPFCAAFIEPCRRPADGRYGENPIRMQHYYQFQVVMKPSPKNMMELYIDSLTAIGVRAVDHDIRFVHDDWESPTLGAWGLGWEVWVDGMEVTQYTYFQQVGGIELSPVMGEITYGLERLCMFLQNVDNVYDLAYDSKLSYGDLFHQNEIQFSKHNFQFADISLHRELFNQYETECAKLCQVGVPIVALDYCLKASHSFNLLDARGAISVNERQGYILRVRRLARSVAEKWLDARKELNFPLTGHPSRKIKDPSQTDLKSGETSREAIQSDAKVIRLPLLIELGVEEIPAKVFDSLLKELPRLVVRHFEHLNLDFGEVFIFTTPRRICIAVASVRTHQEDQILTIKGPPLKIARDENGQWSKAALGFAKKNGVDLNDLGIRSVDDIDYVFATLELAGRCALAVFAETIPTFFASISWYKTMCWGDKKIRFVRPVRWLVAVLGEWVIPTEFGSVTSSGYTFGHRTLAPDLIKVNADRQSYLQSLRDAFVIADHCERREQIKLQIETIANKNELTWREDEDLLSEVTNLVEYPVAVLGSFEKKYLKLPAIVLVSEMKEHQKYFALYTKGGKLSSYFISVSNIHCKDMGRIRNGFERVLRSRFADAEFFLGEDMKVPLDQRVSKLENTVFQNRLGSILEKVERIKQLSAYVSSKLSFSNDRLHIVEHIAHLCKSDLNTNMVTEFPDLQGEIGYHYAIQQGLSESIANGIREHYLPRNLSDSYPSSAEAAVVGISDRIDTLVGIFSVGKSPTGTADPFGLRRACLTCVVIILHLKFRLDLKEVISKSIDIYSNKLQNIKKECLEPQILEFFRVRIIGFLQEGKFSESLPDNVSSDLIKSVVNASPSWYDLTDLLNRLQAMAQFRRRKDFVNIVSTFKRINNILRDKEIEGEVSELKFTVSEEKSLWEAFLSKEREAIKKIEAEDYASALTVMAQLREPVDNFFEVVLVNDPDSEIRKNRKCLLHKILSLLLGVADFSQLPGE